MVLTDDSEDWFLEIPSRHREEARERALSLIAQGTKQPDGCIVTGTTTRRKVRFRGRQTTAYRFIFCVLTEEVAGFDLVVRHRCHNRLCINPDHLELGSRADNKRDDWEAAAYGIDATLL